MANGKVCTGFSFPYVAKYAASAGTVTYSDPIPLARGVDVSIEPETADDNVFYADNIAAETDSGTLTGGTVTLTVDGLLNVAKKFIMGLEEPGTVSGVDVFKYGDSANPPYVGIGFIVRYQSDGVVSYSFVVIAKARFSIAGLSAATQEESIDWQTQELTAQIMRDDSADHIWKLESSTEYASEDLAKTDMLTVLGA